MTETIMPTTEVVREPQAYELAYHVLPTVAEGEVNAITAEIKALVEKAGGVITDEEVAERFELAYEIEKYLEGRYRRFSSAYFGWVRFTLVPTELALVQEEIDGHKSLLRTLTIRLTKPEAQHPFRFHDALEAVAVPQADSSDEEVVTSEEVDPAAKDEEVVK